MQQILPPFLISFRRLPWVTGFTLITLLAAPLAPAAEIIANFTSNASKVVSLPGGLQSSSVLANNTPAPFTFIYDIASLGFANADELRITVDAAANLHTGGGNGIAVYGGDDRWWEELDGPLGFTVTIRDSVGTDFTGNFDIDLTGASLRWADTAPASVTLSIAGAGPFSQTALNQSMDLPTGQTTETSFSATRTGDTIGQFQQLRFDITPGSDTTPPAIVSTNPADNATGVSPGTTLVTTFNEDIALTGTGSITIRDLGPGPDVMITLPDARVLLSGSRDLVINPSSDLLANNPYAIRISADAIQDQAAPPNAFAGILNDAGWDFTTGAPLPDSPNVIVYLLDDFGLTDAQAHPTYFPDGSPLFETPNMHRLASEGMRFTHAYAQPLCSASRACLLSGQDTAARESLHRAIVNG